MNTTTHHVIAAFCHANSNWSRLKAKPTILHTAANLFNTNCGIKNAGCAYA